MKIPNEDLSRSQWENLIDEWIFNEEHRKMLKRNLLDGRTYEQLAEFCKSVYASTQNQEEREIYFAMLDKLKK